MKFARLKNKISGMTLSTYHKLSGAYWREIPDEIEEQLEKAVNLGNAEIQELDEAEIKKEMKSAKIIFDGSPIKFHVPKSPVKVVDLKKPEPKEELKAEPELQEKEEKKRGRPAGK